MKSVLCLIPAALLLLSISAAAQSPRATETATIRGKSITIKYSSPAVRNRKIFGDGGLLLDDAADLGELIHQPALGLQAPGLQFEPGVVRQGGFFQRVTEVGPATPPREWL